MKFKQPSSQERSNLPLNKTKTPNNSINNNPPFIYTEDLDLKPPTKEQMRNQDLDQNQIQDGLHKMNFYNKNTNYYDKPKQNSDLSIEELEHKRDSLKTLVSQAENSNISQKEPKGMISIKNSLNINSKTLKDFRDKIGSTIYSQEKRFDKGYDDCSSAMCKLYNIPNKEGASVSAEDIYRGGYTENSRSITRDNLLKEGKDGQLVFFNANKKNDGSKKFGIDHIGVIIVDKKTNKKYIAEVTKNDTLKTDGSYISELKYRLDTLKKANLYIADIKK
jgi:antitoxin component HigA of HigAB toxin-antitoxin module